MTEHTNLTPIKFINSDDGTKIPASDIQVMLPNNESFFIESLPGRAGSAVFNIRGQVPENSTYRTFSIKPGAQ